MLDYNNHVRTNRADGAGRELYGSRPVGSRT